MPRRAAASNLTLPDSALSVCASHMSAEMIAQEKILKDRRSRGCALTDDQRTWDDHWCPSD